MAGQILYDVVPPQTLTGYARAYDNEILKPQAQFVLGQWMADKMIEDLDYRIRKQSLTDVDVAQYRAWDTPAPMTGRPGTARISGELGPMSRGILLGEEERLRQRQLDEGTDDPIIAAIYDDVERMTRSVRARIEMAIGDCIDDGKVTIQENGLVLQADYGRAATMSVTYSANAWSDTTNGKPLTDLLNWQEVYYTTNGIVPGTLIVPRARLANFALNQEMRQYAAANGTTPSRINLGVINDIFASEGLPPIYVYDGLFRVNGVQTKVLNPKKVYFVPAASGDLADLGQVFWGITAEALVLRQKGLITKEEAPGLVAFVLTQEHPVQTETVASAVALPVMPNPNLVMDMTVIP